MQAMIATMRDTMRDAPGGGLAAPQIGESLQLVVAWYARILQHEVDHLRGVVCCDRMDPRTLTTPDNHLRHWRPQGGTGGLDEWLPPLRPPRVRKTRKRRVS